MKYQISMRKTITDPMERAQRLKRLYDLFTKKALSDNDAGGQSTDKALTGKATGKGDDTSNRRDCEIGGLENE